MSTRIAIVAGAGSGLGQATALKLHSPGTTVIAVDRTEAGLNEALEVGGGLYRGLHFGKRRERLRQIRQAAGPDRCEQGYAQREADERDWPR